MPLFVTAAKGLSNTPINNNDKKLRRRARAEIEIESYICSKICDCMWIFLFSLFSLMCSRQILCVCDVLRLFAVR